MTIRNGLALFLVWVGIAGTAIASDDQSTRSTLVGLSGVYVLVEGLQPEVEEAGLTKSAIQTDAELKLRLAGIRVLTEDESIRLPGAPYLYLRANVNPGGTFWVWGTDVELHQQVRLDREPSIKLGATTWDVHGTNGSVIPSMIPDRVRSTLKDQVDRFINAYLSVNPKK